MNNNQSFFSINKKGLQSEEGFTLLETLIVITIFALALGAITSFIIMTYQVHDFIWHQAIAVGEARTGIETMVKEIRNAQPGDDGSHIIERADDFEFIFYSNIDDDKDVERVRYFLKGTTFKRGVINPIGWPIEYPLVQEQIFTLSQYVRNLTPIFRYFDSEGNELATPARLRDTKLMKVSLLINVDPYRVPHDFHLASKVYVRNL